jgi:hypothetical protein
LLFWWIRSALIFLLLIGRGLRCSKEAAKKVTKKVYPSGEPS